MPDEVRAARKHDPKVMSMQNVIFRPDVPLDGAFVEEIIRDLRWRFVEEFCCYPDRLLLTPLLEGFLGALLFKRRRDASPYVGAPEASLTPEVEQSSLRVEKFWNMRVLIVRGPLALSHRFADNVMERGYEMVRLEADEAGEDDAP